MRLMNTKSQIIENTTSPSNQEDNGLLDEYPVAIFLVFVPVFIFVTQLLDPIIKNIIH